LWTAAETVQVTNTVVAVAGEEDVAILVLAEEHDATTVKW
jgi:uncharacterized protein (UPF0218 family)